MGYERVRVTEELSEGVQRAVGIAPRPHETLGELVKDIAARRGAPRREDLVSEKPTRHEVKVNGETLYTYCLGDALMLPFVLQEERLEVRSESPMSGGGEVTAIVTEDGVEASAPDAVMSFGASRTGDGPAHVTACPYINAFASRKEYEIWAEATPQAVTIALSPGDVFALARDWASGEPDASEEGCC